MVQGVAVGGLSPVVFTSFSVVIVVVPPGVVIFVSCLAEDFFVSVHPMMPTDVNPAISIAEIMHFISNNFH